MLCGYGRAARLVLKVLIGTPVLEYDAAPSCLERRVQTQHTYNCTKLSNRQAALPPHAPQHGSLSKNPYFKTGEFGGGGGAGAGEPSTESWIRSLWHLPPSCAMFFRMKGPKST